MKKNGKNKITCKTGRVEWGGVGVVLQPAPMPGRFSLQPIRLPVYYELLRLAVGLKGWIWLLTVRAAVDNLLLVL